MRQHFPPKLQVTPTGNLVLLTGTASDIVAGQIESLSLALGVIFVVMSLMFLSVKVGFLAILPNVLPILIFFGVMGWSGIFLNLGTSLIAAIALGIAVDSTIHYMARLNLELKGATDQVAAVVGTLRTVGVPIIYATVALFLGFLTFAFSSFVPIQNFGMLTGVTMATALVANLVLLPALLATTKIITLWDLLAVKLGEDPARTIPLFAGLRPAQARIVVLMGEIKRFAPGETIVRHGEMGDEMYVIIQGAAEVFVGDGPDRRAIAQPQARRRVRRDGLGAPQRAQRRRRRQRARRGAGRERALPGAHPAPLSAHRLEGVPQPDAHPQRPAAAHDGSVHGRAERGILMIFEIDTTKKRETIDITERVREIVRRSGLEHGLCHVMVMHATAAIVVNENDDPNIGVDLLTALGRMVGEHEGWLHDRIDNNAQAHILASLLGPSEVVPIEKGDLAPRPMAGADARRARRPASRATRGGDADARRSRLGLGREAYERSRGTPSGESRRQPACAAGGLRVAAAANEGCPPVAGTVRDSGSPPGTRYPPR